jgi:aminomethyltransferase
MAEFAGFEMPMWYGGIRSEHQSVRSGVGLLDLSHMGEIFIAGPQAYELVQHLTCNDIRRIGDGQCQYTLFPTEQGGVVDDLIAYQISPESYMLVVNASNVAKDHEWIVDNNRFDCTIDNRSDEMSLVAVAGPKTDELLSRAGFRNIEKQAAFTFRNLKLDGKKIICAGTGYTGERGFELIVENADALWLWDRLMDAGELSGAVPVGLGARDTLRLEMAYSLYGHELSDEISVLEANLAWTVRLGKDFIGKAHLQKQASEGVSRIIAGIVVDENVGAPRHGAPVFSHSGPQIGYVTSGSFSPSLEKGIALCLIETAHAATESTLQVEIRGKRADARVVETPFYKPGKK